MIIIDLCKWHYDEVTSVMTERVRDFKRKLTNLVSEAARLRRIAKEFDTNVNNSMIYQKIDDLKILIKRIERNECRNIFCMRNVQTLKQFEKIYSVTTFKPTGRKHYTFYYCQLKCFNIMKAKCGIAVVRLEKQQTLI